MAAEDHLKRVTRYLAPHVAGMDRDDLVQETLVLFMMRSSAMRGSDEERFAVGIARNVLRQHWRRVQVSRARASDTEPEALVDGLSESSFVDAGPLLERLEELPFDVLQLLRLQYVEGRSVHEMATELGVPHGTVKSRLYDARKRLQNLLAGESRESIVHALRAWWGR